MKTDDTQGFTLSNDGKRFVLAMEPKGRDAVPTALLINRPAAAH